MMRFNMGDSNDPNKPHRPTPTNPGRQSVPGSSNTNPEGPHSHPLRGGNGPPGRVGPSGPYSRAGPPMPGMYHHRGGPMMSPYPPMSAMHHMPPSLRVGVGPPQQQLPVAHPPPPRQYIAPPNPRKGTTQALIWNFMLPYSSEEGSRNVECCILVPSTDGVGMRKCGATFKHTMGGSTTNLLKHLRKKHPEEARMCLESSKHSTLYKSKQQDREKEGTSSPNGKERARGTEKDTREAWDSAVKALVKTSDKPQIRRAANTARSYSLFCAVDLHPNTLSTEPGYETFLRNDSSVSATQFSVIIADERRRVAYRISKIMQSQQSFISNAPFCSLQIDTIVPVGCSNTYAVATVTYISPAFEMSRVGLDVQSFLTERLTPAELTAWILKFTGEYFNSLPPNHVYLSITIGRGEHLAEAVSGLGIPVHRCAAQLISSVVKLGLTPSGPPSAKIGIAEMMGRVESIAAYILQPSRRQPELAALQEAMGPELRSFKPLGDVAHNFLYLSMALLRQRSLLIKYFSNTDSADQQAAPLPAPLTDAEWDKLCEVVAVLEACAEVDRTIRTGKVASLTETMVLLRELREYMSDSTLYLPEPQHDLDEHRIEQRADQLDSAVWHMRSTIAMSLNDHDVGKPITKLERLAALLDVIHKETLLAEGDAQAWEELTDELSMASRRAAPSSDTGSAPSNVSEAASPSVAAPFDKKRKWQGALSLRKEQRRKMAESVPPPANNVLGEIDTYRASLKVYWTSTGDAEPVLLDWWLERAGGETPTMAESSQPGSSSDPPKQPISQMPQLAQFVAQYHSIDASSIQADVLLKGVEARVAGLEASMNANSIENMLFLRLNRGLICRELEAARGTVPTNR